MTPRANPANTPPGTVVSRFRQRLFQPWSGPRAVPSAADLPLPIAKRKLGFQASIAEFLLVNRLRARRPAQPSADVLERASRIVFVTCQNWFAKPGLGRPDHRPRL